MKGDFSVSICIPTYNGARFLRQAIESALHQTYNDFEILVIDDGSTDNTVEIARRYEAQYPNVRVLQNSTNLGIVPNWMKCLSEARFQWIKFLFQDDVFEKNCVAAMMNVAQQTGKKMVLCARQFLLEDTASEENKKYFQTITRPENIFFEKSIQPKELAKAVVKNGTENILGEPVCLLFDKSIVEEIGGFDDRFQQLMDFDFILRAGMANQLAFLQEQLVHFRVHNQQQSAVNSPTEKTAAATQKLIQTIYGDTLLLVHLFLTSRHYQVMKEVWTQKNLLLFLRYHYLKACKRFGQKTVNEALAQELTYFPELKTTPYNYLRYKIAKYRFKRFVAENAKS